MFICLYYVALNVVCINLRYDSGKVDVGDLTWEQKERVLRYLFARMNGGSSNERKSLSSAPLPAIEQRRDRLSITHSQDDTEYVEIQNKTTLKSN